MVLDWCFFLLCSLSKYSLEEVICFVSKQVWGFFLMGGVACFVIEKSFYKCVRLVFEGDSQLKESGHLKKESQAKTLTHFSKMLFVRIWEVRLSRPQTKMVRFVKMLLIFYNCPLKKMCGHRRMGPETGSAGYPIRNYFVYITPVKNKYTRLRA